jgi:integrase
MSGRRGHGEGSIYRRQSDGKWVGSLDLGWIDGRRKRKVVYGAIRAEVRDRLAELLRQHQQGTLPPERQRLGQYLETWLTVILPASNIKSSTVENYALVTRRHLIPGLGHLWLDQLRPEHVQRLLNEKAVTLSPRSVQYMRSLLGAALAHAERWGYVHRNVARLTTAPRLEKQEVRPLSVDEAFGLLGAAKDNRLYPLYLLAVTVGIRKGELTALQWKDVDLASGSLRVTGTLKRLTGQGLVVDSPKTSRSRRLIPLPEICVAALVEHRSQQQQIQSIAGHSDLADGFVFTSPAGTPLDPRNLTRDFESVLGKAKLRKIRFHDLRHTCASLLLALGVQPRVIMETLGHSGIAITMDLYTHVMPQQQREAADLMQSLLAKWQQPGAA